MNSCFSKKDSLITISNSAAGILALLTSIAASADQFDTLSYSASAGVNYDNNIFRLPANLDPQLVIGSATKSDVIENESFSVILDKKYTNQELQLKANVTNNKFNKFAYLDYVNTIYNAAWNWSLTSRFNGSLSGSHTQTLNSFTDIHSYTRNLTTVDTPRMDADLWLQSNWHLVMALTGSKTTTSQSVLNNQSFTSQSMDWGVKYVTAEGSLITFFSRVIQSKNINGNPDYTLLADPENTETQKELDINWMLSGKSAVSANVIFINHKYPLFYQRDYSGTKGGISYLWNLSDKTNINFSANRSIGSWFDYYSSYEINDTFSITPVWQLSTKSDLQFSISHSRVNYYAPITPLTTARYDQSQSAQLVFDWSPQRSVKLSSSIQQAGRASSYSSYQYDDKTASLNLQITF